MDHFRIRSLALSQLPPTRRPLPLGRLLRRWLGLIIVIGLALLGLLTVKRYWLYAFHDDVLLPIKGWTYTRFFPFSSIVWGMIVTLLALALFSILFNFSPTRDPHVALWRLVVRRERLRRHLLRLVQLFKRLGFQPHLIRLVLVDEWEAVRAQLTTASLPPLKTHLLTLLDLCISVEKLLPERAQHPVYLLQQWHLSFLLLQAYSEKVDFPPLFERLELLYKELPRWSDTAEIPSAFTWTSIYAEVESLVLLAPHAPITLDDYSKQNVYVGQSPKTLYYELQRLNAAQTERINTLAPLYRYAQTAFFAATSLQDTVPPPYTNPTLLTLLGQMILQIQAHVAYLTGQADAAQAYLTLLDSLRLVFDAAQLNNLQPWTALIEMTGTPDPAAITYPFEAANLIAEVGDRASRAKETAYRYAADALLTPQDFELAWALTVEATRKRNQSL